MTPDATVQTLVDEAAKLLKQGRRTFALDRLDDALKLAPQDAEVLGLRGVVLAQTGDRSAALRDLRRAVELRPDDPRLRANLAVFLLEDGDRDAAGEQAEAALALDPADAGAIGVRDALGRADVGSTKPHAVPVLVGREEGWMRLAYVLLALGVANTILLVVHTPVTPPGPGIEGIKQSLPKTDLLSVVSLFAWIFLSVATLLWVTVDLIDRRARLIWMVPQLILGLCAVPWVPLALYLRIGRLDRR